MSDVGLLFIDNNVYGLHCVSIDMAILIIHTFLPMNTCPDVGIDVFVNVIAYKSIYSFLGNVLPDVLL